MERGFSVSHNVHGNDIVSHSNLYIHEVLFYPGTSWGFPDFSQGAWFMGRLWKTL